MTDKLQQEIQAAIEANLPSATAKILSKRLEEGEDAIAKVPELIKQLDEVNKHNRELQKKVTDCSLKEESLKTQELELKVLRTTLEKEQLELKVRKEEREASRHEIFKLVETVFKNPVVRKHTSSEVPVVYGRDQYGNKDYGSINHETVSSTETLEVEGE